MNAFVGCGTGIQGTKKVNNNQTTIEESLTVTVNVRFKH